MAARGLIELGLLLPLQLSAPDFCFVLLPTQTTSSPVQYSYQFAHLDKQSTTLKTEPHPDGFACDLVDFFVGRFGTAAWTDVNEISITVLN